MSFFYGLVEGLATSANEALKNDIKRINTRVDSIAQRQLEKALKEQEKRAEEVAEVEAALKEGYALFGGDANSAKAKQYAAGLLKEIGSLDAYKQRIAELRDAKNNQSVDINQFFTRASEDAPTGSFTDYANAFLGAPKTFAGDYRIPEDMRGQARAGSLISKVVGKPIDVVQMGLERGREDIAAAIGTPSETATIALPNITFKSEEFKMFNMSPSERLKYINERMATPSIAENEDELNRYSELRNKAEKAVLATKNEQDKLSVLQNQFNRAEGDEAKSIAAEISSLKRTIKMKEASTSDNPLDLIDAQINVALSEAIQTNDFTEVEKLRKKRDVLAGEKKSPQQELNEDKQELQEAVLTGTLDPESAEYKEQFKNIQSKQRYLDTFEVKPTDITRQNAWQRQMTEAIDTNQATALAEFSSYERGVYEDMKARIIASPEQENLLREENPDQMKIYDIVEAKFRGVKQNTIETLLQRVDKEREPEAYYAAYGLGYIDPEVNVPPITTGGSVSGSVLTVDEKKADKTEAISIKELEKASKNKHPDTVEGAEEYFKFSVAENIPSSEAIEDAIALNYSGPFIEQLKKLISEKSTTNMEKIATQDANMASDNNSDLIQQIVDEGTFLFGSLGMNQRDTAIKLANKNPDMDYNQALQFIKDNYDEIMSLRESQKERKPKPSRGRNRRSSGGGFTERRNQ